MHSLQVHRYTIFRYPFNRFRPFMSDGQKNEYAHRAIELKGDTKLTTTFKYLLKVFDSVCINLEEKKIYAIHLQWNRYPMINTYQTTSQWCRINLDFYSLQNLCHHGEVY